MTRALPQMVEPMNVCVKKGPSGMRAFLWTFQRGMQVNSQTISGFLRLWLIAKLRPRRPKTYRYDQEQRAIEAWLALIVEAARLSADRALEIAESPLTG